MAEKSTLLNDIDQQAPAKRAKDTAQGVSTRTMLATAAVIISMLALSYAIWTAYASYKNDPRRAAWTPTLKDSESGEVFEQFALSRGSNMPYKNPKTGKNTLYPVETCYWTKDGKAKMTPTYVILNSTLGKPGKTVCPDCGRSVTMYNPRPPDHLMQSAWESEQPKNK